MRQFDKLDHVCMLIMPMALKYIFLNTINITVTLVKHMLKYDIIKYG